MTRHNYQKRAYERGSIIGGIRLALSKEALPQTSTEPQRRAPLQVLSPQCLGRGAPPCSPLSCSLAASAPCGKAVAIGASVLSRRLAEAGSMSSGELPGQRRFCGCDL
jgi:hypothetical protein